MSKRRLLLILLSIAHLKSTSGILVSNPNQPERRKDLVEDPDFNCSWLGGSNPQLVCSCLNGNRIFYIEANSISSYGITGINITNCNLKFGPNAIADMRTLREIYLGNISRLTIEEYGLYWFGYVQNKEHVNGIDYSIPSLKIHIENSEIQVIRKHGIKGRVNRVHFRNVTIENIEPFGFNSLEQTVEVVFDGVKFREVQPQAFKKFKTLKLVFENVAFGEIPSRGFYEIEVNERLLLKNVFIDVLKPSGFVIFNPQIVEITCKINFLNGEGFKIATRGDVSIKNSFFNDTSPAGFRGFSLNLDETSRYLYLENIIFNELYKDSLVINETSFKPVFSDLYLNRTCVCGNAEKYPEAMNCQSGDGYVKCTTHEETCSVFTSKAGVATVIGLSCAGILVIAVVLVLCYVRKLYRCGSYGQDETKTRGKVSMIVPDGRTYRETELHVIVEKADLLTTDL